MHRSLAVREGCELSVLSKDVSPSPAADCLEAVVAIVIVIIFGRDMVVVNDQDDKDELEMGRAAFVLWVKGLFGLA